MSKITSQRESFVKGASSKASYVAHIRVTRRDKHLRYSIALTTEHAFQTYNVYPRNFRESTSTQKLEQSLLKLASYD